MFLFYEACYHAPRTFLNSTTTLSKNTTLVSSRCRENQLEVMVKELLVVIKIVVKGVDKSLLQDNTEADALPKSPHVVVKSIILLMLIERGMASRGGLIRLILKITNTS